MMNPESNPIEHYSLLLLKDGARLEKCQCLHVTKVMLKMGLYPDKLRTYSDSRIL